MKSRARERAPLGIPASRLLEVEKETRHQDDGDTASPLTSASQTARARIGEVLTAG